MDVDDRVRREQRSYDSGSVFEKSATMQARFKHVFASKNTRYGHEYFDDNVRSLCRDAVVLDYGCLGGGAAPRYREHGARRIIGIDISEKGIAEATRNHGGIAEFRVCDAHNLHFIESATVDFVVGTAILHHLEFERAIREVIRVLKRGGKALFTEPLYDNPASKIFRRLTPKARTADERPLSGEQIEWANRQFASHHHRFCNLVTTPVGIVTSQLPVSASNPFLNVADFVDRKLEKTRLKYWMREVVLLWQK